jgi:hypothetical protein
MLVPVRSGTWNVLFGLVAMAFGQFGGFVLPGTTNPMLLVGAGALVFLIGVYQLSRSKR